MSSEDGITVAPVPTIICRRERGEERDTAPLLPERDGDVGCLHRFCDKIGDFLGELCSPYCFISCVYFFFCHAVDSVILHVCCCRCLDSLQSPPELLEPRNRTQKALAFCIKQLSNLWVTTLLFFVVRSLYLRPFDVKPMLGACTVHEFDLEWPASVSMSMAPPHLRFNLTTHVLFKNTHQFYSIGYDHPAAPVLYAGEKLGPVDDELPPFKQEPHRSTVVDQVVVGRLRNASSTVVETFARDRVQGRFQMVVRVRVTLTYKRWPLKAEYLNQYDCPLSSPVPQIGEPALSSLAPCKAVQI